ncbi:MAG: tyrosine-type recombinase/integrase [Candidatus Rhabdochlamydia sp.]
MTLIIQTNQEIAPFHQLLDQRAKEFFDRSKADNTKKSYQSDWEDFEEWCQLNGFRSMPADVQTVVRYLTDRASHSWTRMVGKRKGRGKNMTIVDIPVTFQPLKTSSIERRLSAISKAHQYAGHLFDRKNVFLVDFLKGIKREKGSAQDQKTAVLTDDIKAMTQSLFGVCGIRDRAIILLGFTAALRRSEIVSLQISDLLETKEGFEVIVRFSKTDQEGEGKIKTVPYGSHQSCPVFAIKTWLDELNKAGITDGPLFRAIDRYGHIRHKRMCDASIALIVKRNDHIKGKADKFGGHSLRAGFCTQAALNNVPDSIAMLQSGHKDANMYRKYVRVADRWKNSAAKKLGL